jgi:hypothetical protein
MSSVPYYGGGGEVGRFGARPNCGTRGNGAAPLVISRQQPTWFRVVDLFKQALFSKVRNGWI